MNSRRTRSPGPFRRQEHNVHVGARFDAAVMDRSRARAKSRPFFAFGAITSFPDRFLRHVGREETSGQRHRRWHVPRLCRVDLVSAGVESSLCRPCARGDHIIAAVAHQILRVRGLGCPASQPGSRRIFQPVRASRRWTNSAGPRVPGRRLRRRWVGMVMRARDAEETSAAYFANTPGGFAVQRVWRGLRDRRRFRCGASRRRWRLCRRRATKAIRPPAAAFG